MAVRFPHRREALKEYTDTKSWMEDDERFSRFQRPLAALVEVTSGRCKLNGPWTDRQKENIPRALRALGALPANEIEDCANALYANGRSENLNVVFQLIAVGNIENTDLQNEMPKVEQINWSEIKPFIYCRFCRYKTIKREHPQWDYDGKNLWDHFSQCTDIAEFSSGVELTI